jgi:exo-beta-1,3-glucanase (GH17 family)
MVMFRSQGKEVWIVTGWPSRGETIGEAVPNPGNASRYFQDFISWTKAKGVSYCYSQAFDNNIKDGIWDETINIKPGMEGVFLGE